MEEQQVRGRDLQPNDVFRFNVPFSDWYGQIERLEPHDRFGGWYIAHCYNARSVSIDPDSWFYIKRPEATCTSSQRTIPTHACTSQPMKPHHR